MKAISLSAPYGTLIAIADQCPELGKRIETRGRATAYRGSLAIHQAKSLRYVGGMNGLRDVCIREPFKTSLRAAAIDLDVVDVDALPLGAIVAVCELVGVAETCGGELLRDLGARSVWPVLVSDPERSFGDYTPGRYAWLLANIRALPEPIMTRGRQWLWDVDPTIDAQIAQQFAASALCPRCGARHLVSHYSSGDKVWCTKADLWFQVWFRPGGAQLEACDAPAGWPRETKVR